MDWRDIPSCPGYQASDSGGIRSLQRVDALGRSKPSVVLRQQVGKVGYATVGIYSSERKRGIPTLVHRLVCEAFHGPPPFEGARALHWVNDKLNNTPGNIHWGTQLENMADKLVDGTQTRGESHGTSKLTDAAIRMIRNSGRTNSALARHYDVHPETIRQVRMGRTWIHVE